jgi:hypothetical protein
MSEVPMSTSDAVVWASLAVAAVNGGAGAFGALQWYRVRESRAFWAGLRAGQALALGLGLGVGVLWLGGRSADDSLFYLYALLPLAVGFLAEQLRVLAAEQVLAARGLDGAQAVGELEPDDQQAIVVAILRREMGVMAAAGVMVCFLALRAAGTAHGF